MHRAALRNPTISPAHKAGVLFGLGVLLTNVEHKTEEGLQVMYQAAEVAPREFAYRITLIQFLIALKRFEAAGEQIRIVRHLDMLGSVTPRLKAEERALANAMGLARPTPET